MKRFRRIFFNALTSISLILALAAAGFWIRSRTFSDRLSWLDWIPRSDEMVLTVWEVHSEAGSVNLARWKEFLAKKEFFPPPGHWQYRENSGVYSRAHHGINWYTEALPYDDQLSGVYIVVRVPYWILVTLSLIAPLAFVARWTIRRQKRSAGRCPACGYDLRASPGRCPECGLAIVRSD